MTNPFDGTDGTDGTFYVLVNDQGQDSMWPVFAEVPAGWRVVHGPATWQNCTDYAAKWTGMRPRNLIEAMRATDS